MCSGKALVLDFGGVISRTLFETHALTEKVLGLKSGTLTWRGPFDPDSDPLWRSMQSGDISERDYWLERTRETAALVGQTWTRMEEFVTAARGADPETVIRPEALDAIAAAKRAGCKLAILSNELDLFYGADFRKRLPLLADFDLIVDATHTGILKPASGAFVFIIEGLGIPAANCVFVDDQAKNIAGAVCVGMQTVHFDVRNPRESYDAALDLLGVHRTRENG
ncbi:HAD family hydrolase [Nitratireductor sp. GCM10026969]|uniref:HAD family hydrolase n=1 Tax=Nitratireductor sp. GCM10026969 TaxID=3252645 RepID=UPI00361ED1F3